MQDSPTPLSGVIDALQFAAEAHREQRRADKLTPYLNHLVELVWLLAVEAGVGDGEVLKAAAVHGYLAECCGRPGQPSLSEGRRLLRCRFGERVLACVEALDDDAMLLASRDARLVMLAGRIAELRDLLATPPEGWSTARKCECFDQAKAAVDRIRGTDAALERLFDEVHALRPAEFGFGVP